MDSGSRNLFATHLMMPSRLAILALMLRSTSPALFTLSLMSAKPALTKAASLRDSRRDVEDGGL